MWIWIIVIAVAIGAFLGYAQEGNSEDAIGGGMAGGCMAAGCLMKIAMAAIGILLVLWLFGVLFPDFVTHFLVKM